MAQEVQERPVRDKLLAQIKALDDAGVHKAVKTRSRRSKVRSEFVGHTLAIYDGESYRRVRITQDMVGRTLAQIVPRLTPTASSRYLSISPRKMRQVADLVQGLPVEKALNILNFTPKIAAHNLAVTLKAAVANKLSLEGTSNLDPEDLRVKKIDVMSGPTAKRVRFQSMGRVFRVRKRSCHLSVYLETRPEAATKAAAPSKPAAKRTADSKKATTPKKKKTTKVTKGRKSAGGRKPVAKPVPTKGKNVQPVKTTSTGQKGTKRGQ